MPPWSGIELRAPAGDYGEILTADALALIAGLHRAFDARRRELLKRRAERQRQIDAGHDPDFLPETAAIRAADWTVASIPNDLTDRRVEITGPVDRKMIINALNSGASVFMADFEDATTPTWENLLHGQRNLRDAIAGAIRYDSPDGKHYTLHDRTATLMVRPRGWHLPEKHVRIDGQPMSGSLFDFGLFFFHNARALIEHGSGPYFYLPKIESHIEARLWNDVFNYAQDALGIPRGTIRATVLIETILAAFEMDEILYELREHSAGLNCGRWDYLFSCIKKFRNREGFVLADRALLNMTTPFMRAYSLLTIKTCHRRRAHAIGGMAAQIPIKNDPAANETALAKVRADKEREATDGHDGTWVAHPGLVPIARDVFDRKMPTPHQIDRSRDDVTASAHDLLNFILQGPITEVGVRLNIEVAVQYLGAWLGGQAAVPIHHLMEDAATAEISRAQLWHWLHSPKGVLDDGRKLTVELFRQFLPQETARVRKTIGDKAYATGHYDLAAQLLDDLTLRPEFAEFLTLPAYEHID